MGTPLTLRYYGKTSDEIFRDLVYYTNGYRLPRHAAVVKVEPNPFQAQDPLNRDTQADVAIPPDPCCHAPQEQSVQTVTYSRLNLSVLQPRWDRYFEAPSGASSTYDLLNQINEYFNTCFTVHDLEDVTYPAGNFALVLKAKPLSIAWQGQYGRVPQLANLIPIKKLSGFKVYVPDVVVGQASLG